MRLIKFFHHSGFSMTEIMVAMGLLGGVSLVGMKLAQESTSNESYLRFKSEVAKASAIVQTYLSDPNTCRTLLVGEARLDNPTIPTATGYLNGDGRIVIMNKAGTANIVLLEDDTVYDGFRIPQGGILLAKSKFETTTTTKVTDLVIVFEVKSRNIAMRGGANAYPERIIKRIPIRTEHNTDGTIKACGNVIDVDSNLEAKKSLCDNLGAAAATWDGTECRIKEAKCPLGEVPREMTSLGHFNCVPVEDKIDPSIIFDTAPATCTGSKDIQLVTGADGKIKITCGSGTVLTPPSGFGLSHSSRAKTFTVSWTAGSGNGGAGGCKIQYQNFGSSWVDITNVNCDAAGSSAGTITLPGDGWYGSSWSSASVRLVRVSDSAVMGTLGNVTCSSTGGSGTSTPTIDENCNNTWDDSTSVDTCNSCTFSGGISRLVYFTDASCTIHDITYDTCYANNPFGTKGCGPQDGKYSTLDWIPGSCSITEENCDYCGVASSTLTYY